MSAKKKRAPSWLYSFPDGTDAIIPLVESERTRLRAMARMLEHPAATPEMRDRGELILEELAQLLALARAAKIGSGMGAAKRREAGDRKAAAVRAVIAEGKDPMDIVSDRHLRRISKRSPKK